MGEEEAGLSDMGREMGRRSSVALAMLTGGSSPDVKKKAGAMRESKVELGFQKSSHAALRAYRVPFENFAGLPEGSCLIEKWPRAATV